MNCTRRTTKILAGAGLACLAGLAAAEEQAVLSNISDVRFAPFPDFPTCATGAVQKGDPATQPSIIIAKMTKGCTVPWHWHTPNEHLMMTAGEARLATRDGGKAQPLRAGGFALMPAKHVHRIECVSKVCVLFVYADAAPFDIHYADAQGNEIPPGEALKAVKETAAK
ncbi:MAG: cupin domain-containing protein [Ignavibacteria bacterium]